MQKIIAVLLTCAILLSFAACARNKTNTEEPSESVAPIENVNTEGETDAPVSNAEQKILVIYFSSANTANVDVVSSATPKFGATASTELLAQYIHDAVGGDLAKITPEEDYPEDYNGAADQAKTERDSDERPAFLPLEVNPEGYDVIFVGYPIWWYTLPMVMYTFFDTYDFSGKTIIPFNTHAGSGNGGTYATIAELEPNATISDGFNVSGSRADNAENDVKAWLNGLGY
ncbi:MAG: flavodoxin [Clostridia bacterium]|nr:flavodoxin [Clostridia bacterium]